MNTLIERLEALTAPCKELDALIYAAAYVPNGEVEQSKRNGAWCIYVTGYGGKRRLWEARRGEPRQQPYTASIDAAMTLVPENLYCSVTRYRKRLCKADVGATYGGRAPTPAIALCIAALKAREATNA